MTTHPAKGYHPAMTSVKQLRTQVMGLPARERASLAHDLILSLDDPQDYALGVEQEVEIAKRVQMVREGAATGRAAEDVFKDIRAHYP